jgi:hypothetical protein
MPITRCCNNNKDCPILKGKNEISDCVELDNNSLFGQNDAKFDCYISYIGDGAFVVECKTSNLRHFLQEPDGQLYRAYETFKQKWPDFQKILRNAVPPHKVIIYMKEGFGNERLYERRGYRLFKKGNGPVMIGPLPVFLYQKNEIEEINNRSWW